MNATPAHRLPAPPASVAAALVDMFHRRAPAPIIALNILFGGLLVLLWWGSIPAQELLQWLAVITLVALINILRHRRYEAELRHGTVDTAGWRRTFIAGTFANGLAWGAGGMLFYNPAQPLHSAVILLLICGIAAGVAASQASVWPAVVLFAASAILPPALAILSLGEPVHMVAGGLLLFYLVYILTVGDINHRTMLDATRLQFENSQLLHDLREREQHFRSLVENAPDMLMAVGRDGQLLFHSPSMEALLGYSGTELDGHPVFELIHPEDHALVRERMQQLLKGERDSGTAETRWRHANGAWLLLQCVARRISDSEPAALVVNARDITERRAMEDELRQARDAAEQASRIKSQFLATMSHEIRTPLHAILGMAELLQHSPLSNTQQGYVGTFQDAGRHLLNLIDDILDFSRIEAGGLQLADHPLHLPHLLEEVDGLLRAQARAKGLQLHISRTPGLAPWRRGDAQRLRQVIVNLLGNAIKFTPQGQVELKVAEEPGAADTLRFTVTDTGIGIAPEQQSHLFAPFSQLDAGQTRQRGGTGLGLSICRRLIDAMGGRITVESSVGVGSRFSFTVRLPQAQAADNAADTPAAEADLPPAHLLVADDSAMNRLVIKEFLSDSPCRITFADNGMDTVDLFMQHPFDLVLMDIQMPRLDGWSATRRIRAWEAEQARRPVPIVALSASAMEEDRLASLEAGCTTFTAKPLGRSQLLRLLQQYLNDTTRR
ncbi:MAG: ATP-binding protein [Pseudomonadota bacterium]